MNIFAPKSTDFVKKSEVFIIFEYSANEVVMFVAQCGLNEFQSKKCYAEKMSAQDDELNKLLAERDELKAKCEELEKKVADLEWARETDKLVKSKLLEQKNKAQG